MYASLVCEDSHGINESGYRATSTSAKRFLMRSSKFPIMGFRHLHLFARRSYTSSCRQTYLPTAPWQTTGVRRSCHETCSA